MKTANLALTLALGTLIFTSTVRAETDAVTIKCAILVSNYVENNFIGTQEVLEINRAMDIWKMDQTAENLRAVTKAQTNLSNRIDGAREICIANFK